MTAWVKFHEELTMGSKREIPRATRFIFMELSLKCRPGRGSVDLRTDMPVLDSVCELLGSVTRSDRLEVRFALARLTEGEDPLLKVIEIGGGSRRRSICIPSWEVWNAIDLSTERVQKFREKKRQPSTSEGAAVAAKPDNETRFTSVSKRVSPVAPETERNAVRSEEIRGDKNTPLSPPTGGASPAAPESERVKPVFRRVL